jgi:hypothetical protein
LGDKGNISMREKLFKRLDSLEAELRQELIPALRRTATGQDDLLFLTDQTNPYPELRTHSSGHGQLLFDSAQEILRLATKLGVSKDELLASMVVKYFNQAHDLNNHHRAAPSGIARQFLLELGEQI